LISLASYFRNSDINVLIEKKALPFFSRITGISNFIEYDAEKLSLFSKEFSNIEKKILEKKYDLCLMLMQYPPLELLYMAGISGALVRIGIKGSNGFPFLNLHVVPSPSRSHLTDKSLLLASVLGVPVRQKAKWLVSKEAIEEVNIMLKEMKVSTSMNFAAIDGEYFIKTHGKKWLITLLEMLKRKSYYCYFLSLYEPDKDIFEWAQKQNILFFSRLSVSRTAALLSISSIAITGPTVFFEFCDLINTPVIGIFEENEYNLYCKESNTTRGLKYYNKIDSNIINMIEDYIDKVYINKS